MPSILQYQALSLHLYLLQDEACPIIKEGRSKRMDVQGQSPEKKFDHPISSSSLDQ